MDDFEQARSVSKLVFSLAAPELAVLSTGNVIRIVRSGAKNYRLRASTVAQRAPEVYEISSSPQLQKLAELMSTPPRPAYNLRESTIAQRGASSFVPYHSSSRAGITAGIQNKSISTAEGKRFVNSTDISDLSNFSTMSQSDYAKCSLIKKMSALQKAQEKAVRVREFEDGRVRYYTVERLAKNEGLTSGSSHVTEYNSRTGQIRSRSECYDHNGNVNRVNPKMIDGQTVMSQHYPMTQSEKASFSKNNRRPK